MAEPRVEAIDSTRGWAIEWRSGTAEALHVAEPLADSGPSVWVCRPARPALVLGSIQRDLVVPRTLLDRRGVDLVRRRSGGGAVLLDPADTVWVDLVIPRGHPLWDDDVGRATHWVGRSWGAALARFGVAAIEHRGPMHRTDWSPVVCFAGLGPGEVVDAEGRKLVGISQRRSRDHARFQTVAYRLSDPAGVVEVLGLGDADSASAAAAVEAGARELGLGDAVGHDDVVEALIASLPQG